MILHIKEYEPGIGAYEGDAIITGQCSGCDLELRIRRRAIENGYWTVVQDDTTMQAPDSLEDVKDQIGDEEWEEIMRLRKEMGTEE